jgi:uncharacterized protein YecE (DUF72 family)
MNQGNRQPEIRSWIDDLRPLKHRGVTIFVYANSNYAGHGPETVAQFLEEWNSKN